MDGTSPLCDPEDPCGEEGGYFGYLKNIDRYESGRYIRNDPHWFDDSDWDEAWRDSYSIPNIHLHDYSIYESTNDLVANNDSYDEALDNGCTVDQDKTIVFMAKNEIILGKGFTVKPGSLFTAFIGQRYVDAHQEAHPELYTKSAKSKPMELPSNKNQDLANVQILPTIIDDYFVIRGLESSCNMQIINQMGQEVYTMTAVNNAESIHIGHLPNGIYMVRVSNETSAINVKIFKN